MIRSIIFAASVFFALTGFMVPGVYAATLPFNLSIQGPNFDVKRTLKISDLEAGQTSSHFTFKDKDGKEYEFDLKYKELPANRSFPGNLDITIKDVDGIKRGYLFLAINNIDFLHKMGIFGLVININGDPVDVKFTFDKKKKGQLSVADLSEERFFQDTLVPKFNFQMIRPVILPKTSPGTLSQTYALDKHPYAINYTVKDLVVNNANDKPESSDDSGGSGSSGIVEFQHNLYQVIDEKEQLLERIYFQADSLETLREAMYAGKYFHPEAGTFKLVFYPALGQTKPRGK
jgi:hypothetical protein